MTLGISPRRVLVPALALTLLIAGLLATPSSPADAHPLGNFTINRYSRIELYSDVVRVYYVLDMAEIPAFQERGAVDANGDGEINNAEADAYAAMKADETGRNLALSVDDGAVSLAPVTRDLSFPEGQGGLDTLRLSVVYEGEATAEAGLLEYADHNYGDRLGWKEIVVDPSTGATFAGEAPTEDVSKALTAYPEDLLSSPSDVTSVSVEYDASNAVMAPALSGVAFEQPEEVRRVGGGFASLIDKENLTLPVVLIALLSALAFGAIHALEPGHGKTLVAAYFVGVKGNARQALGLGGIVAVTHSIGVFAVGLVTIFASQWILPEKLYPWLSLASGVMVLLLGLRLIAARGGIVWLRNAANRLFPHRHRHHAHEHEVAATPDGPPPWQSLFALGLADGLTPSPSALVVLLAAVSLDRIELGVGLIVAFSIGLATVLTGVAVGLTYARILAEWLLARVTPAGQPGRLAGMITPNGVVMRVLPVGGAVVLVAVGVMLTVRALSQPGLAVL
jgi:nickel/cobalt transporter (NicO) family protein